IAVTLLAGTVLGEAALIGWFRLRPDTDVLSRTDMVVSAVALVAGGLPALADLCATHIGDSVTVERRAAAYAWLDMAQGIGALLGVALPPLFSRLEPPKNVFIF